MSDEELGQGLTCFVIGPIGDRLAPVGTEPRSRYENATQMWENVFEPATRRFGLDAIRADKVSESGEIPEQIFTLLRDADVVIADLTGGNANVMYELGMRHTRDKLTIQIGEHERLPFDVNTIRTIQFRRTEAGLIDARESLTETIRSGLEGRSRPVTATRVWSDVATLPASALAAASEQSQAPDEDDPYVADAPGFMDILAEGEAAVHELVDLIQRATGIVHEYGGLMEDATAETAATDGRGGGFAGRLTVARNLAVALDEPAREYDELSEVYLTKVSLFDAATDYLISQAERDPEQRRELTPYLQSLVELSESATQGNVSATNLLHSVKGLPAISRVLTPISKTMSRGLNRFLSANETIGGWGARIRDLPGWVEPSQTAGDPG